MVSSILTELEECKISNGVIVQGFSRGHCDQDPSLLFLLSLTATVTPQTAFLFFLFFFWCIWPSGNKRGPGEGARDEFLEVFRGRARACHQRSEAAARQQVCRVTVVGANLGPVLITATALMNSTDAPRVKFAL